MRYIKQFIKKLSPDYTIKKSNSSNSEYIKFANGFFVRLSDHMPSSVHNPNITINIVSAWNSDKFIIMVYGNTLPVIKTRKEVKEHVRVMFENWELTKAKKDSDKKHQIDPQKCKTVDDFLQYNQNFKGYNDISRTSLNILGTHPQASQIPTDVRRYMLHRVISQKEINVAEFLSIAVRHYRSIKDKPTADKAIDKYIANKKLG